MPIGVAPIKQTAAVDLGETDMQAAWMVESLDQYGGDGVRKRKTSRLWYRQPEADANDEISCSQHCQSRGASLLAPDLAATVDWSGTGERIARA